MYEFRMLGIPGLTDASGHEVEALLRQPKHLALLGYLALPHEGAWHSRDEVVGALWPENNQRRARAALRSALHTLRRHLPDGAVRSRGDEAISIDPDRLRTDVALMISDFEQGDYAFSLARYRGELLSGLYVQDSPAFDKWLDTERRRVRGVAQKSAAQLSIGREGSGDMAGAIEAARTAASFEPDDEASVRRLISLLDRAGDRTQAFAVYERFREHTMEAFGIRPSAETVALLDSIRTRHVPGSHKDLAPARVEIALHNQPVRIESPPIRRPRLGRRSFVLALVVVAAIVAFVAMRPRGQVPSPPPPRSIVVLPMANETGDPNLAYLATGIAEGVAERLDGIGGFAVHSGARSDWDFSSPRALKTIGSAFGSRLLIESRIAKVDDSLEVSASVVDATSMESTPISARRFSMDALGDVQSKLAADIAGTVFRAPIPTAGRAPVNYVNPESYRLTLEGWHLLLSNIQPRTTALRMNEVAEIFLAAVNIDPRNARAWSGLSSAYSAQTVSDAIPFDEGFDRASAAALRALAIDSLQGTAMANLGILRAMKHRRLSAGIDFIRKAESAEAWNPEIFLIKGAVLLNAHEWDAARDAFRVARQLDPLSSVYVLGEARADFCRGEGEPPLTIFRAHLALNPNDRIGLEGRTRALAMLGRFDEAIASWRDLARVQRDRELARGLASARGAEGYWGVSRSLGRRRLTELGGRSSHVSPLRYLQAHFAAGDEESAYRWLDRAEKAGVRQLYRLQCMPEIDEFRDTPRMQEAIRRIGSLAP